MNWDNWSVIEAALLRLNIKPVLAVVPNNRDPVLVAGPAKAEFWDRVRFWQDCGWTIALHGFEHHYSTTSAGIIPIHKRSEFAGLPASVQEDKLRRALQVFQHEGVRPTVWIAPSHSFDAATVSTLSTLGIRIISDGFAYYPFRDAGGMTWVPQQLWGFADVKAGVWTICHHPNSWTSEQVRSEIRRFESYRSQIVSLDMILASSVRRHRSLADRLFWKLGPISQNSSSVFVRAALGAACYWRLATVWQKTLRRGRTYAGRLRARL